LIVNSQEDPKATKCGNSLGHFSNFNLTTLQFQKKILAFKVAQTVGNRRIWSLWLA